MVKIKPKCMYGMEAAVTATGWLVPCCWCDQPPTMNNGNFKRMILNPKLSLSKIKNINEITYSDGWQEFKKHLIESNIDKLPPVCKKHCEVKDDGDNKTAKIKKYYYKGKLGHEQIR